MKAKSDDTLSAPSLLLDMGDAPEQQRILASLEGKGSATAGKPGRIIKFTAITVLLLVFACGVLALGAGNREGWNFWSPVASEKDPEGEPSGAVLATTSEPEPVQVEAVNIAVVEEITVPVVASPDQPKSVSGSQQSAQPIQTVQAQETAVQTQGAQSTPQKRQQVASGQKPRTPRPARASGGRRGKAAAGNSPPEHDVIVLTGVLDAFYETEGIPLSLKNQISAKMEACGKQPKAKQERCRQNVCAKFWGRVPECPKAN